jgi:tetratricopeptide (TPR) repeat protein
MKADSVGLRVQLRQVGELREAENFEEALKLCAQIISGNADSVEVYFERSRIFFEMGRSEDGFVDLDFIIELVPEAVGAYVERGARLLEYEKFSSAIDDGKKIVSFHDDYYIDTGNFYQAISHLKLGQLAGAKAACLRLPVDYKGILRSPPCGREFVSRAEILKNCQ